VPSTDGFAQRLRRAVRYWEDRSGDRDITQGELAEKVASAMKRAKPFSQGAVSGWFSGTVPDADVIGAIAEVCGVRAGWLAYNEPPMVAPPPTVLGVPQLPHDDMGERTALTSAEAERLKLQQEQTAARSRRRVAGEGSRRRNAS
jgi:hypothetical protein